MNIVNHRFAERDEERITTIVADDSPAFLHSFCHYLRLEPGTAVVGTAGNGFEAIELVRRMHPRLVVIDLHMPGPPGDRAAAWIAEHYPDIHILLVSTDAHPEIPPRMREGGYAFLCKNDLLFDLPPLLARWFPPAETAAEVEDDETAPGRAQECAFPGDGFLQEDGEVAALAQWE